MNHCKDCKWFREKPPVFNSWSIDGEVVIEDFGECKNRIFYYIGNTIWDTKARLKKKVKDKLFLYEDAEKCRAYFYVHKNFGCIGFEEKEQ